MTTWIDWNYRVCRFNAYLYPTIGHEDAHDYDVIEVYYDPQGDMIAWCPRTGPMGNTPEELRGDLIAMLEAFTLPQLDETDLPGALKRPI